MTPSEPELLARAAAGSNRAFAEIVDQHQQAVRTFLRRVCSERSDIDDIAQETFLAAWAQAGRYRGGASIRTWLCAIAWRKAKTAQRSWFRRRAREADYHTETSGEDEPQASAEDRLAVRQALLTLPIEQRAAAALCLAQGFSHAEAAEVLGAPLGTVKSHVTRGRARLLQVLSESPPGKSWQDGTEGARR